MKTIVKDRPPRLSRQFLRDQQWVFDHMPELKEKYPDQWILVHQGQVIASGEEATRGWQNATELGLDQPYLHFVEKSIYVYQNSAPLANGLGFKTPATWNPCPCG